MDDDVCCPAVLYIFFFLLIFLYYWFFFNLKIREYGDFAPIKPVFKPRFQNWLNRFLPPGVEKLFKNSDFRDFFQKTLVTAVFLKMQNLKSECFQHPGVGIGSVSSENGFENGLETVRNLRNCADMSLKG